MTCTVVPKSLNRHRSEMQEPMPEVEFKRKGDLVTAHITPSDGLLLINPLHVIEFHTEGFTKAFDSPLMFTMSQHVVNIIGDFLAFRYKSYYLRERTYSSDNFSEWQCLSRIMVGDYVPLIIHPLILRYCTLNLSNLCSTGQLSGRKYLHTSLGGCTVRAPGRACVYTPIYAHSSNDLIVQSMFICSANGTQGGPEVLTHFATYQKLLEARFDQGEMNYMNFDEKDLERMNRFIQVYTTLLQGNGVPYGESDTDVLYALDIASTHGISVPATVQTLKWVAPKLAPAMWFYWQNKTPIRWRENTCTTPFIAVNTTLRASEGEQVRLTSTASNRILGIFKGINTQFDRDKTEARWAANHPPDVLKLLCHNGKYNAPELDTVRARILGVDPVKNKALHWDDLE